MRLYRTNCALSSDDGLCVEMRISGGGHVAVAVGRDVAEALDDLHPARMVAYRASGGTPHSQFGRYATPGVGGPFVEP